MFDELALPGPNDARASSTADSLTGDGAAAEGGAVLRTFKHHALGVNCLALLPDGLRFVSGSDDETARIAYHGLAL